MGPDRPQGSVAVTSQDRERLERVGFIAHRTARELAEVRARFPVRDRLAVRLHAIEEEARGIAGEVLMELREAEGVLP